MARLNQLIRSISSNWVAFAFSAGLAFFLSPFIVHHLGNVAYGVWTLIVSMISFMGLLDLGLRGAVTRFVSSNHTQGNHLQSSRVVSAAFWLRIWICLGIVGTSLIVASIASRVFHIPQSLQWSARWAIILVGTSLALTLASGVFGSVLVALNRFSLVSGVSILQSLVRALGLVLLLKSGHGILGLAILEFSISLGAGVALWMLCFRAYPQLHISLRRPDPAVLRQLVSYSFYAFLIHSATQLIYNTDNIVVGAFVSAEAVTFYAIGGSLLEYLRQVVSSVTMIFMPLASNFEARGEQAQLRRLLVQGTRGALFIALPIALALFFRGHTFIQLWMGDQYAGVSGRVLEILLISQTFSIANFTSGNIAFGLAKHRPFALSVVCEALANLTLSIILVRRMGIYGVAWGTIIPNLLIQFVFWPRYICKLLGIPVWPYLWQSWIRPFIAAVPFGAACCLTDHFWVATHLPHFFLQILILLPIYFAMFIACFWKEIDWQLRSRFGWLYGSTARKAPSKELEN
jgi:O-antigen/teichoic acid export membrane protein